MMQLQTLTDKQRTIIRKNCLASLYCFCKTVMGYEDITEELHGEFCRFLEGDGERKQVTMPRSFVKTWISSIAYPIWITLPRTEVDEFPADVDTSNRFWQLGPNMRILIASYVIGNSEKMLGLIRRTYESNMAMQILFPEVIPHNFKKTKWSNQEACINRTQDYTEQTFEAAGIGGSSTSRHYDLIIEDDLIYANKDDFSGQELQPNQEDIDKAIGWHKINTSLLVPGKHTRIHNTGTRWAKHDLVDFIWRNEPHYKVFRRACVKLPDAVLSGEDSDIEINWKECALEWGNCYDLKQLEMIAAAQGPYLFATQYLLMPISPEELLFKSHWLQLYMSDSEIPTTTRRFTTVDLSEWDDKNTRKSGGCNGAILTCDWDDKNHVWIRYYDYGRFNPLEVLQIMAKHWNAFAPECIYVEEIYYQKALAFFARQYMDERKLPRMTIRGIRPESNLSKDLRIRALEPHAATLAIHCKTTHVEFIKEWREYIPGNKLCPKDLLDCLAYQRQVARPGEVVIKETRISNTNPTFVCTADELLKYFWEANSNKDLFGNPSVPENPFTPEEATPIADMLAGITDPFAEVINDRWSWN